MRATTLRPILLLTVCAGALLAGCATVDEVVDPDCPGHWHFMLGFYIDDELVPFDNTTFLEPGPTELHWDTGRLVHLHPHPTIPRCIPLEESMETLHVRFLSDAVELGPAHGRHEGTYPIDEDARLIVRIAPHGGEWADAVLSEILPETPPNGARILFSHGDPTEEALARQQASVPLVPSRYLPSE